MSSRIIRGDDRVRKQHIHGMSGTDFAMETPTTQERAMNVEKQAFEQGYQEGERIGKEMGERMVESAVKRYDRSISEMATAYKSVLVAMEVKTVQLALHISRKVIQREVTTDPDLVSALASVALRRVQSHNSITLRVSRHDYPRVSEVIADMNPAVIVKEDPGFERGDFIVDSSQTHLDGRIFNQVDTLGRALLEE